MGSCGNGSGKLMTSSACRRRASRRLLAPIVLAAGCAAPNAGSQISFANSAVPPCEDQTVAVGPDVPRSLLPSVAAAGYTAARFVDEPDLRPQPLNDDEILRALMRSYPAELRDAGIGGSPTLLVLIDPDGVVIHRVVVFSSGYEALDRAALSVADVIRFSPTMIAGCRASALARIPIDY